MGRVYKVYGEKTKDKIALKLLKPEVSGNAQAIERFSNELRFSRKISHRHVCRMFDLGEVEGTHYITMEDVPGEDLKSILHMMGPMSAGKAVLITREVCEDLAEAHRLGVVHHDLKPQNIMIDREGSVRIMDFGIARSLKVKGMTGAGVVIGTPEYMSPEQIEGEETDPRSDIYSLEIILYEMMTGRLPFEGETFLSIALKQKTAQPRNPREINSQIPDDMNRLILRCLEKDKEKRYQKGEDILVDLAKIEKGVPTTEKVLPSVKPSTSRAGLSGLGRDRDRPLPDRRSDQDGHVLLQHLHVCGGKPLSGKGHEPPPSRFRERAASSRRGLLQTQREDHPSGH